jgi:serine acetyltransferase
VSSQAELDDAVGAEAPRPAPAVPRHGLLELIRSDYDRHADLHGDDPRTRALKAPIRHVTNTSLRAQLLIRICCASPRWLHWFFRSLLITLHSSEIVYGAQIGPRMHIPHPYGIGIGGEVRIGSDVTICQNVTIGSDLNGNGQPDIGDSVVMLAGAMLAGPITIGDEAVVGANTVLMEDLAPGGLAAPAKTRVVNRRVNWAAKK